MRDCNDIVVVPFLRFGTDRPPSNWVFVGVKEVATLSRVPNQNLTFPTGRPCTVLPEQPRRMMDEQKGAKLVENSRISFEQ